jgi:N-acetylmuramoyl-L-alanine amidase-like protein
MATPDQNSLLSSPTLELVARGIRDPVVRLRFLKYVAPVAPAVADRPKHHGLIRNLTVLLFLAAMLATALMMRAGTPVKLMPAASPPVESPRTEPSGARVPSIASAEVWQVEDTREFETYSNGLRIDNRFTISNHPRSYLVFPAGEPGHKDGVPGNKPVGIVFHTTESHQAPFEPGQTRVLQRIEESLIEYVQRKRAYHFLIDRFGRVYRVVAETDAANHAGFSVWADERSVYVNLNESFLGVSFEAETQPGQVQPSASPAQVRAAAMLTEMLRSRGELRHPRPSVGKPVKYAGRLPHGLGIQLPIRTTWITG